MDESVDKLVPFSGGSVPAEFSAQTLLENLGDGVWVSDGENLLYVNSRLAELIGLGATELVGAPLADLFSATELKHMNALLLPLWRHELQSVHINIRLRRHNKPSIPVSMCLRLMASDGGVRVIAVVSYIDETHVGHGLAATQAELNKMLSSLSDITYQTDADGCVVLISEACLPILGYRSDEIIGRKIQSFYSLEPERMRLLNEVKDSATRDAVIEASMRHKDGSEVWFSVNLHLVYDENDVYLGTQGVARDVTLQHTQREQLQESEAQYRTLYEMTQDAVMLLDETGFFDCNQATVALFGCRSLADFCTKHPADLSPALQPCGTDSMTLAGQRIDYAMTHGSNRFEWVHQRADNAQPFAADVQLNSMHINGRAILQAVVRDISKLKASEAHAMKLAFYDSLTGLPNRRLLEERFDQALAAARRTGHFGAVIFLDLDNFKQLNDLHGHAVGDLLLVRVAERLTMELRERDTVSRFGGDEFIILLEHLEKQRPLAVIQAMAIATKILASISAPIQLNPFSDSPGHGVELNCSASIGVELFDGSDVNQHKILEAADKAMYQAKRGGRNAVKFNA